MSFFSQLEVLPPDPIFGLSAAFKADPRPDKYTFITGYFLNEQLTVPVLDSIASVEEEILAAHHPKEYLPIDGDPDFIQALEKLVFGQRDQRVIGMQTVGGTGALSMIAKLATNWTQQIAISNPTWANHWNIFSYAGLTTIPYSYEEKEESSFEVMCRQLKALPKGSCVLIHTSCHNPTGLDLLKKQWEHFLDIVQSHHLFPILDMAYQGFGGTLEEDAYAARLFMQSGMEFALTYTCAKNFSIYGERAGALFIVAKNHEHKKAILSQIKAVMRATYSNPPRHAAALIKGVLNNETRFVQWKKELESMRKRIKQVRTAFAEKMSQKDTSRNWKKVANGKGLFCLRPLSQEGIEYLRKEKGFYLAQDGRINLTGINHNNIEAFTDALTTAR